LALATQCLAVTPVRDEMGGISWVLFGFFGRNHLRLFVQLQSMTGYEL
jgi:hypothetical protein